MATLLVTRTRGDYGEVRFKYETRPGTATENVDYMATSGEMVLSNGVRNITINITIVDDALMEPNETFTVLLTSVTGQFENHNIFLKLYQFVPQTSYNNFICLEYVGHNKPKMKLAFSKKK